MVLVDDEVGRGQERAAQERHFVLSDFLQTVDDDFALRGSVPDHQLAAVAVDIVRDHELVVWDSDVQTGGK